MTCSTTDALRDALAYLECHARGDTEGAGVILSAADPDRLRDALAGLAIAGRVFGPTVGGATLDPGRWVAMLRALAEQRLIPEIPPGE